VNRTALIVGVLVITPLLIFLALSFRSDPRDIASPLIGKTAPLFTLQDLEGEVYSLEELRGQPVVINFWATWCQPCIAEHPVLVAASRRYEGRVKFLGVIYNDEPELIQRFVQQMGAWGPSLVDENLSVALAYGVYGAPETFFIDASGTIVDKATGAMSPQFVVNLLESLLSS
jgi:cytochrome c biogenesis protein CcmG/thiol:disulfide interchange protein DsbE